MVLAVVSTIGIFSYYIVKAPLTKTLYFEFGKSALIGGLFGYGYYRYQNYQFTE